MVYGKLFFYIILTPVICFSCLGRCYACWCQWQVCYCLEDLICLVWMWQMLLPRGRWYILFFVLLADVIANVMWQIFSPCYSILQLLNWLMLLPSGRCNSHMLLFVLNVIWADVIALWQMEWPLYWCFVYVMADVISQWQMEWPLQGVSASLLVDVVPRGQMDMGSTSFRFQFWGIMQNLIPYMRQMVLAYVFL